MAKRPDSNEIRLTRVYDAPVRAVWSAWTEPDQVAQWWGPRGFTITTHSKDLRAGGSWRYTMHGPDGVDYPNVTHYLVVEPLKKLVYDHGATDETPPLFRVTVTFTEADGKTTMEMVSTLPTPEAAAEIAKLIKRASGESTWDRLAEHLGQAATGKPRFVVHRVLDAPIATVFAMWTSAEHLTKWLAPAGTEVHFLRSEIAVGKSTLFTITGGHGTMFVRAEYVELEPPRRIVYLQQFVDEHERLAPAPGAEVWPPTLRTTVVLTEEAPDRTRIALTCEAEGEATAAELEAFALERAGMTRGWTGSFDALESLLERRPEPLTVSVEVACGPEHAWRALTDPSAIPSWNFASPEWCCPRARNELRPGGTFSYRMEARDGSMGFDFEGELLEVVPPRRLRYSLGPEREVLVELTPTGAGTEVRQTFTPDGEVPLEQQRAGWQAILDNYKRYAEGPEGR